MRRLSASEARAARRRGGALLIHNAPDLRTARLLLSKKFSKNREPDDWISQVGEVIVGKTQVARFNPNHRVRPVPSEIPIAAMTVAQFHNHGVSTCFRFSSTRRIAQCSYVHRTRRINTAPSRLSSAARCSGLDTALPPMAR